VLIDDDAFIAGLVRLVGSEIAAIAATIEFAVWCAVPCHPTVTIADPL
jgi:hypothetical protein